MSCQFRKVGVTVSRIFSRFVIHAILRKELSLARTIDGFEFNHGGSRIMAKGDWWLKLDIHKWLNDPKNRRLKRENRDSWLTACLMMTLEGDYKIAGELDEIANLLHLTHDEMVAFLSDLCRTNVADVTQTADFVTIVSRRFKKACNSKELGRLRKQKERGHAKVTVNSRDRVISKKKEERKQEKERHAHTQISFDDFVASLRANPAYSHIDLDVELAKAEAWAANHGKRFTRKFVTDWMNRIEPPLRSNGKAHRQPVGNDPPPLAEKLRREAEARQNAKLIPPPVKEVGNVH